MMTVRTDTQRGNQQHGETLTENAEDIPCLMNFSYCVASLTEVFMNECGLQVYKTAKISEKQLKIILTEFLSKQGIDVNEDAFLTIANGTKIEKFYFTNIQLNWCEQIN